ncbi:MAG: hypothetical protein IPL28_23720 [Chloroflexi bacterium]|nr:hypothetical protein [Chloroflexota bacterium]
MSVADLLAAAQMVAPPEKEQRMQALLEKQGLEGWLPAEEQEAQLLATSLTKLCWCGRKRPCCSNDKAFKFI